MIKKLLYGFVIIAGLVSCNDDYTDWASPQSNEAKEAAEKLAFTVQPSVSSIDFATETTENIQLFTTNLQAGQTNEYTVTFSAEDKTETAVLKATAEGKVSSTDLQATVTTIYGKAPVERTLAVEVVADVKITTENGSIVTEKKASPFSLKVKLEAPQISQHYYIIGAPSAWDPAETSLMFNHSGKDVYDDPIFTIVFPVKDGETWFAISDDIAVEKNDWSYVFGCAEGNGNNGMEGKLARRSNLSDDGSWKIVVDGDAAFVRVTLNMMDYTYTIKKIVPEYYIVGAMQGWNSDPANGKTCMLYPQSNMVHSYTTKFENDANLKIWLGSDFGNWDACYGAADDGSNAVTGTLVSTAAGAAVCPEKGAFYTFTADFSTMTYTWTKLENQEPKAYTVVSLIGAFNDWNQETNIDLKEVTPHNWYRSAVTVTEGELKFCANDDRADSWGGKGNNGDVNIIDENSGETVYNGANFFAPAGTYNVFFNDITGEYVFQAAE